MLDVLLSNSLLVACIWGVMYIFDFASTLWLAKAYQTTLNRYTIYEGGVELNPAFEKEIARGQVFNPKFIAALVIYFLAILFSDLVGRFLLEFLSGALILTWVFINSRHLRNYIYIWMLQRKPDAIRANDPNIYSYWLLQRLIATEALAFSLIYFFITFLTFRLFFFAGGMMCLGLAIRHWLLANRKLTQPQTPIERT